MAVLTEELIRKTFQEHLDEGETLKHCAFGMKQPNIFLLFALLALAILPGIIAILLLSRTYLIGLTERRFLVLTIKSAADATVKEVVEYDLDEIAAMEVKTSTGALFTHIVVKDETKPFRVKCARAFSKSNGPSAKAIAEAIS